MSINNNNNNNNDNKENDNNELLLHWISVDHVPDKIINPYERKRIEKHGGR